MNNKKYKTSNFAFCSIPPTSFCVFSFLMTSPLYLCHLFSNLFSVRFIYLFLLQSIRFIYLWVDKPYRLELQFMLRVFDLFFSDSIHLILLKYDSNKSILCKFSTETATHSALKVVTVSISYSNVKYRCKVFLIILKRYPRWSNLSSPISAFSRGRLALYPGFISNTIVLVEYIS